MHITVEQVVALAPDPQSVSAGKKLGTAAPWRGQGRSSAALWGECQGSATYQTKVDLTDLAYNCSCPSRKLPCKHVLGLLLLAANSPTDVREAQPPEWVTAWLTKRAARAEAREEKQKTKAPPDPKAQAKRAAQRHERILAGLDELDLWLDDLVRSGLAGLERQPHSFWKQTAQRLVDAQARGLAGRVETLSEIVGSGADWPRRLLSEMGRIALLSHAYRRLEGLAPDLQQDVRQLIGWTITQDEVQASGTRIADRWLVLGQTYEEDDRIRTQRSWLVGTQTGTAAMVLQFSAGGQPFAESILPGTFFDGDLFFYPGQTPQRAQLGPRTATGVIDVRPPGSHALEAHLQATAETLARQPWHERFLWVLHDVQLVPQAEDVWLVRDADAESVPVEPRGTWTALALAGGAPLDLVGEWNGCRLRLLGAFHAGVYHHLVDAE